MNNNFAHLRMHTEYSLTKGLMNPKDALKIAKNDGQGALAITDTNSMFGAIKFYEEGINNGVKPIMGCDLTVYTDPDSNGHETHYQMLFLAKNNAGYKKIMHLLSEAYLKNNHKEKVGVYESWLNNTDLKDVIILSGAREGIIGKLILEGKNDEASKKALELKNSLPNFYIELQRDATIDEIKYMDGAIDIAKKHSIPVVATHPNLFATADDFIAHEARVCIKEGEFIYNRARVRVHNKEQNFKTKSEMIEMFSDIPEAIENTVEIAKACNLKIDLNKPNLPIFNTGTNESPEDFFKRQALEGLNKRLLELFPDKKEREQAAEKYKNRLLFEVGIIKQMGFIDYFLIVSDFIKWSKNNDVAVGPGRGSGAGSLVAYSLEITDIDPLKYNLLFERFLNPERVSMPDFDIDFEPAGRESVINYVKGKYGNNAVSQICNLTGMNAKGVVRDVNRILNYSYSFGDTLAKMINIPANNPISLAQYIEEHDDLKERIEKEPEVRKLISIALKLEGVTRQIGKHAAGVLISPTTIDDFAPLYLPEDSNDMVSQFDKKDIEKAGLVKFDFLVVGNLTIIKDAVREINKKDKNFDIKKISFTDLNVFEKVFQNGNTGSIFQFESSGMRSVIMKAKPTKFEDLIALNALYRPGPMDIISEWLDSKHGVKKVEYADERLKPILEETYGYMIYQEQVMEVAKVIAGYTLGGADLLRRAMGYKIPAEMEKQRAVFTSGAVKNGLEESKAKGLFDLMEKFSGYGFNKSHAAAYSYLGYQTAFLKHYYPAQYMTAVLNSEIQNTDKICEVLGDCKRNKLNVLAPDINKSNYSFSIENSDSIRYSFGALKGVGESASLAIERARLEKGNFVSFFDFLEKVGKGPVNKKTIESLIKSGAFDTLHPNRAQLFDIIEEGRAYLDKYNDAKQKDIGPLDEIFPKELKNIEIQKPLLKEVTPWNNLEILDHENTAIGFYFSNHPFKAYEENMGGLKAFQKFDTLEGLYNEGTDKAMVAGLVHEVKPFKSGKGAFVKISNGDAILDTMIFQELFEANKDLLKPGNFISSVVRLQLNMDKSGMSVNLQDIFDYSNTLKNIVNKIYVAAESDAKGPKFKELCEAHPGSSEISLCVHNPETNKRNKIAETRKVIANEELINKLKKEFGEEWVKISYLDKIDILDVSSKSKNKKYGKYNNKK